MTSIPRESVPSLPRPEVSERPLLEGVAGRGSAGFEDFLFPLSDPTAQAFFRSRPKPEPTPSTRPAESRESDSRSTSRTEKPDETRDDESRTHEDSAAAAKTEASRRASLLDESPLQSEVATDPSLIAAPWAPLAVEPETISEAVEETSEDLSAELSVTATPTGMLPIQAVVAEVSEEPAAHASLPLEGQPIGDLSENLGDLKPLPAASSSQVTEAPSESPVIASLEGVTASPVQTSERQAIEIAETIAPPEVEIKVAAAPAAMANPLRVASTAATAATAEVADPESEPTKEPSPDGQANRSSGMMSLAELAPSLLTESISETQLIEAFVETSEAALVSSAEASPNLTRDSQAAPANATPVSAMVTPTAQTQLSVPTPTPPPAPSMATPPSRWLQGGEYRRFLHRMDRAFELAGQRGGEIRLRLSPPRLGSIRLEMSMNQERMVARIETDSEETRQILLEQFPVLRERLAERGVAVESFQVETRREGDSASSDQRDDSRQRRLRRDDERDIANAAARGTGPIICRLPMSGNHLTGLDVIV